MYLWEIRKCRGTTVGTTTTAKHGRRLHPGRGAVEKQACADAVK